MFIRLISAALCIFFIQGLAVADDKTDYISASIGQFDINDTKDSAEYRVEYLNGGVSKFSPGEADLKSFYGAMINGDDGKYFYAGLRKDIEASKNIYFTPVSYTHLSCRRAISWLSGWGAGD